MTRLWVTGMGVVTALGWGVEATWSALCRGERGIGPIDLFDTTGQRTAHAGQVKNVVVPRESGWSRSGAMALAAAEEAMAQAKLSPGSARAGVIVAGTTGGMFEAESLLARLHAEPDAHDALVELLSHPLTSTTDRLEERLGPFARSRTLTSACSSGANALVVAANWLLAGLVDVVVAGASDGLCRLTFTGFNALAAIDPEMCRPFDRRRKGLNLGEGAGFVVLERAESAERRGAAPIAELAGWAVGAEAHHITNPEPTGDTAARLMTAAMARAKLAPSSIDYVNAHGTGTPLNDPMESAALARALGDEVRRVAVSSSKAQIGHTLGAAGAIEAAITALAVARDVIPPTAGLEDPDPACALVHVPGVARPAKVRAALSSSFGFGGMDTVLVLAKPGLAPAHDERPRDVAITGVSVWTPGGKLAGLHAAEALDASHPAVGDAVTTRRLDDAHLASLDAARARRMDRASRIGAVVVGDACADAGLSVSDRPAQVGVVLASAFGSVDHSAAFMHRIFEKGPRLASPAEFPNLVPSSPIGHVSIYTGLRGPALGTADLATSAESAIVQAIELVASGEAGAVVGGGVEELSSIVDRVLAALFGRADAHRSEGAAAVVVEAVEHARARGARILARIESVACWRRDAPASLVLGDPSGAVVVVPRRDEVTERILAASGWGGVPRIACADRAGEHEGLGGIALGIAVARVAAGANARAVVLGRAEGRGYALCLSR